MSGRDGLETQWAQNIKALSFHVFMFVEPSCPPALRFLDFPVPAPIAIQDPSRIPLEIAVCALAAKAACFFDL